MWRLSDQATTWLNTASRARLAILGLDKRPEWWYPRIMVSRDHFEPCTLGRPWMDLAKVSLWIVILTKTLSPTKDLQPALGYHIALGKAAGTGCMKKKVSRESQHLEHHRSLPFRLELSFLVLSWSVANSRGTSIVLRQGNGQQRLSIWRELAAHRKVELSRLSKYPCRPYG